MKPYDPGRPCEIKVEFTHTDVTEEFRDRQNVERIVDRTFVSQADNWWAAWQQMFF